MSTPPEQFARIAGKVDLAELGSKLVVIVGVGSLGSQIARELAHSGVGYLRLIDGDRLEETNVIRHALPRRWLGWNKAEALTIYLAGEVPTLHVRSVDQDVDEELSDAALDELLGDADLVIAATDDRQAQRQVNACTRRLDITTISPGLYEDDGGEVFVQRRSHLPCFSCWDEFRPADATLRAAVALNVDTLPILFLAVELCLGVLDRSSVYFRRLVPRPGEPVPLLYRLSVRDEVALGIPALDRRRDCPVCGEALTRRLGARSRAVRAASSSGAAIAGFPSVAPSSARRMWMAIGGWLWLILFVGSGMSLAGAYMARHEVGYPGEIHEFLPMMDYLLEISFAAGVAALAAIAATEVLSLRSGEPPGRYSPAIMLGKPSYVLTPIAVAVSLVSLFELRNVSPFSRLSPDSLSAPFWWWIIGPALVCLVHVVSLVRDRWRARQSLNVALIPGAALSGFVACVLLFGWSLPPVGSQGPSAIVAVPADFRPCEPASPPPHTFGHSLECHPDGVKVSLILGNTGSNSWIYDEMPAEGVSVFGACPQEMPGMHAFYIGSERVGSLLCKYAPSGNVVLVWTDLRADTYSVATFPTVSGWTPGNAYQWWRMHAYEGSQAPTSAP